MSPIDLLPLYHTFEELLTLRHLFMVKTYPKLCGKNLHNSEVRVFCDAVFVSLAFLEYNKNYEWLFLVPEQNEYRKGHFL